MIEQLLPNVWRVGGRSWDGRTAELSPGGSNVYLVVLGEAGVLIDCGILSEREIIEANIREAGVDLGGLTDLILTHSHWDHSEAGAEWQKAWGLRVHLNSVGAEYLTRGDLRLTGSRLNEPGYEFPRFRVDHGVGDGESFEAGGGVISAHHVPGHTPDSTLVTMELSGECVGVCGDATFGPNDRGQLGNVGWLSMLWESNLHDYRDSLKRMSGMEFDLLLPGHGSAVVGPKAAAKSIAGSLATIEHFLADPLIRNFGMETD
jgi:metallo-beta-lactamase class B